MLKKECRLVCVHKNRLFSQCLVALLSSEARFAHFKISEVDGTSENLPSLVHAKRPQVALVDLSLPQRGAAELTRHLRGTLDATVVLIVSAAAEHNEHDQQLLLECVEAGAQGFVYEQSSMDELRDALEQVEHGRAYCSHVLMESMMNQLALFSREARWRRNVKPVGLTRREQEILAWIAEGLSNKQVASKLSLSTYTVKNHVHKILQQAASQPIAPRQSAARSMNHGCRRPRFRYASKQLLNEKLRRSCEIIGPNRLVWAFIMRRMNSEPKGGFVENDLLRVFVRQKRCLRTHRIGSNPSAFLRH